MKSSSGRVVPKRPTTYQTRFDEAMVMKQTKRAVVNRELCVACGSCQKVCPVGAIRVYKGLYAQPDEARCIGCGRCAKECPASVITVEARHEN